MPKIILAAIATLSLSYTASAQSVTHSCESLAQLELSGAKILSAQTVAPGAFTPPPAMAAWMLGDPNLYKTLPAFCRVIAEAKPSADSSIKIEVWIPTDDSQKPAWNGNLQGWGNGGFAGEIYYQALAIAVKKGYAAVGTDTGHSAGGTDASWALGHPEKVADFGYRGIHEMTRVAKSTIKAFSGKDPQHSYFIGCSNGGRQALMEAQRFPDDYDGILAGAPANYWTHLLTKALADAQATTLDPASYIPPSKLPAIAHAVNAACDAQDGVADGILNDPRRCHFDPAAILCKQGDSDSCLTAPQITALKKLYAGPDDASGKKIFPGYLPGAEEGPGGWAPWITGSAPGKSLLFAFSGGYFSNIIYEKADWNYRAANVDAALKLADEKTASILNATNPNLAPFKAHGGKLILYHGWNDPAISALNTINYFTEMQSKMGGNETEAFARLYMVPGMQHCQDGPGPDSFGQSPAGASDPQYNIELALEQWVEKGIAPTAIIASKFGSTRPDPTDPARPAQITRPLCPFPKIAKYQGSGDTNDAANFSCSARGR
jgi:tannase/feruloyl esterase